MQCGDGMMIFIAWVHATETTITQLKQPSLVLLSLAGSIWWNALLHDRWFGRKDCKFWPECLCLKKIQVTRGHKLIGLKGKGRGNMCRMREGNALCSYNRCTTMVILNEDTIHWGVAGCVLTVLAPSSPSTQK